MTVHDQRNETLQTRHSSYAKGRSPSAIHPEPATKLVSPLLLLSLVFQTSQWLVHSKRHKRKVSVAGIALPIKLEKWETFVLPFAIFTRRHFHIMPNEECKKFKKSSWSITVLGILLLQDSYTILLPFWSLLRRLWTPPTVIFSSGTLNAGNVARNMHFHSVYPSRRPQKLFR